MRGNGLRFSFVFIFLTHVPYIMKIKCQVKEDTYRHLTIREDCIFKHILKKIDSKEMKSAKTSTLHVSYNFTVVSNM